MWIKMSGRVPDDLLRMIRKEGLILRAWREYRQFTPWTAGARLFPDLPPDLAAQRVLDEEACWEEIAQDRLRAWSALLDVPIDLLLPDFYFNIYGIPISEDT